MRATTIVLGGKSYSVTQPPFRLTVAWQKKVAQHLQEILKVVPALMTALAPIITEAADGKNILDLITEQNIGTLATSGSEILLQVLDVMPVLLDLIYEYDEPLMLDKERIEKEATEEEVLTAFVELAKLSFPFGTNLSGVLKAASLSQMASVSRTTGTNGSTTETTLPSSPLPSGADGMTSSTT